MYTEYLETPFASFVSLRSNIFARYYLTNIWKLGFRLSQFLALRRPYLPLYFEHSQTRLALISFSCVDFLGFFALHPHSPVSREYLKTRLAIMLVSRCASLLIVIFYKLGLTRSFSYLSYATLSASLYTFASAACIYLISSLYIVDTWERSLSLPCYSLPQLKFQLGPLLYFQCLETDLVFISFSRSTYRPPLQFKYPVAVTCIRLLLLHLIFDPSLRFRDTRLKIQRASVSFPFLLYPRFLFAFLYQPKIYFGHSLA